MVSKSRKIPVNEPGRIRINLADEGNYFLVTVELPGIEEEDIRIDLEKNVLVVSWSDHHSDYFREELVLPKKGRLMRKKFNNGNLQIVLEKSDD